MARRLVCYQHGDKKGCYPARAPLQEHAVIFLYSRKPSKTRAHHNPDTLRIFLSHIKSRIFYCDVCGGKGIMDK